MTVIVPRYTKEDIERASPALRESLVLQDRDWRQRQSAAIYQAIAENYVAGPYDHSGSGRMVDVGKLNDLLLAIMSLVER